ncbi:MAG: family 43 glycosylhydrolase, partial [Oscillospiraceae bacterium]|nr:family 43 glycosylhydrolase [Oscillospiraceae bacterium]
CIHKNGTYYYYYPHPSESRWNDTWKIGVATSKHPPKDFTDIGYIQKEGVGGWCMIDPNIFIDDDGRNYLYFGGGNQPKAVELEDDMIAAKGEVIDMIGLEDFHEASWVFKRNGIYYMTFSDNLGGNNRLRYAMSDSPLGPWDRNGIYLAPTGCDTSHGSVVEFKGRWYAFYHNCSISGRGNLRSVCVDEMFFNEDGTIQLVEQTDGPCEAVGPAPEPNSRAKIYPGKLAIMEGTKLGKNGVIRGFDNEHEGGKAFCYWSKVDGYDGGRVTIRVRYTNPSGALNRLRLIVNDQDWSLINLIPTRNGDNFTGDANFTVPMKAGMTNIVKLMGFDGAPNVAEIKLEPLD